MNYLSLLAAMLLTLGASAQNRQPTSPASPMETALVTKAVTDIFVGSDVHDWNRVKAALAPQVLLDYSSMTQQPAATLTPDQILAAWQGVLPGFEHTHHQLGNFDVQVSGNEATVFCYGMATHYLAQPTGGNVWTVVGTYNFHLRRQGTAWKADRMKFNFKYQDGNLGLPKLAAERVKSSMAKTAAS